MAGIVLDMNNPYLSLVVSSRNDEHGGNMLLRMQVSLSGLLEQLEKYRIESEIILVEWNPPAERPLLKDIIKWPGALRYCTIRVIVVPPAIHRRYKGHAKLSINRAAAFNVGIRRARGQFILFRPIDLIYSDDLVAFIATKRLERDEIYRIDRCDVDRNVVRLNTLKEQLNFCKQNIIKIHSRRGPPAGSTLPYLHTNASGDFQLLSREYWHLLRGYPEIDIVSPRIDALLSHMAYAAGVKEVILDEPMRLYHIDHDDKFGDIYKEPKSWLEKLLSFLLIPKSISSRILYVYHIFAPYESKAEMFGVLTLGRSEYQMMRRDIIAGKRSYAFNNDTWGLGEESLDEFVISTADWDKGSADVRGYNG